MRGTYPSCRMCRFQTFLEGTEFLLCTLPPECAPPHEEDPDDDWRDREDRMAAYLGTSCDVMRRMDAMCGPRGNLWTARDGEGA